jgi:quercetin dioxygenase-like cupin family protein
MQYRTHADGPLTTISVEPGAVRISMLFDVPGAHARLHSHTFPHTLTVKRGPVRIEIDGVVSIKQTGETYLVEAHKQHSVYPLTVDAEVDCVHEHADIHPDRAGEGIPLEWLRRLTDEATA